MTTSREYVVPAGMPLSVFENKYSRPLPDGRLQTYAERVSEVVAGNFSLDDRWERSLGGDYQRTLELAVAGVMPTSGRHLQHGDREQRGRMLELHSNCSTALFSFMLFRLLLRGSGVGRSYSSAACRVDWSFMPDVRLILDEAHPDFRYDLFQGTLETRRNARHKYDSESERVRWFTVADSREGWSKLVEILETAAFQEKHRDKLFVFDFSDVRPAGAPIAGLQNRPASGPIALMTALERVASLKGAGLKPWKQALFVDHYLAECVHLGGARRAARIGVKSWRDRDVLEFVDVKRGGFLWSANLSIGVDAEFWAGAARRQHSHARRVFEGAVNAAYYDGTGEPGFLNLDRLTTDDVGLDAITGDTCVNPRTYVDLHPRTAEMIANVLEHVKQLDHRYVVNPCGEIVLALWGGLCVIADVCLANADPDASQEALDAAYLTAQFLVRVNLMRSDYEAEVRRTNRIGVGLTGIHEYAWRRYRLTFREILLGDRTVEEAEREGHSVERWEVAQRFWRLVDDLRVAAEEGARDAALRYGLPVPHTMTTIKPSGTISKIMNCTEGAHLPARRHYLRWVQYRHDDPALVDLTARGYPVRDVSRHYPEHVVVGFPTCLPLVAEMGDALLTAEDVTPEEQYRWLRLLERHWLGGDGRNNQVSYTLKYDPRRVSYDEFMATILDWQPRVRCAAVMPFSDWRQSQEIYGYVPEEPITETEYDALVAGIRGIERERYDPATLDCEGGACPVEPDARTVS